MNTTATNQLIRSADAATEHGIEFSEHAVTSRFEHHKRHFFTFTFDEEDTGAAEKYLQRLFDDALEEILYGDNEYGNGGVIVTHADGDMFRELIVIVDLAH